MKKVSRVVVLMAFLVVCCLSIAIAADNSQDQGLTMGQVEVVQQSVSVAGYFQIEKECIALDRDSKQVTRTLYAGVDIEGSYFSVPIIILEEPNGSLRKEFSGVHFGDLVWLHIQDDGKILEMNKKKPIKLRHK